MSTGTIESLGELEAEFNRLETLNPRKAAELAYVAAHLYKNAGKRDLSQHYAKKSIALFEKTGVNSLEEAASHYTILCGVNLPSYIHENVVRHDFADYDL